MDWRTTRSCRISFSTTLKSSSYLAWSKSFLPGDWKLEFGTHWWQVEIWTGPSKCPLHNTYDAILSANINKIQQVSRFTPRTHQSLPSYNSNFIFCIFFTSAARSLASLITFPATSCTSRCLDPPRPLRPCPPRPPVPRPPRPLRPEPRPPKPPEPSFCDSALGKSGRCSVEVEGFFSVREWPSWML